jgi:hypothetical protein
VKPGKTRVLHIFPSDVKARHDKMVELVELILELDKGLPKARLPNERESIQCRISVTGEPASWSMSSADR